MSAFDELVELIDGIVADPGNVPNLLESKHIPLSAKNHIFLKILRNGKGAHLVNTNFYKTFKTTKTKHYEATRLFILENFQNVLIESLKCSTTITWLFELCASEIPGKVNFAHICSLMCDTLDLSEHHLDPATVQSAITNVIRTVGKMSDWLSEPEFKTVLEHRFAGEHTLPSEMVNIKKGVDFAKRFADPAPGVQVEPTKTVRGRSDIVSQCIDTIADTLNNPTGSDVENYMWSIAQNSTHQ